MSFNNGPTIVTNGLVLALDAGDRNSYPGSGTTWRDLSGNNNNGTLTNGPTFNSANLGSIVFDGVDDFVNLGGSIISSGAFTFCAWINMSSLVSTSQVILSQGTIADGSYQYLAYRTGYIVFNTDGSATFATANSAPIINTWYNVVGVYNPSITNKTVLYINSIEQTLKSTSNASFSGTITSVGRSPFGGGGSFFNGKIPSVQIYNRALSASEVLQNYNATKTRFGL